MEIIKKYWLEITIGLLTAGFIILYPIIVGGSPGAVSEFRGAFGSLAAVSYLLYLGVFSLLSFFIKKKKLPAKYIYFAHAIAFVLGYYLLFATYFSIANGGLPSIV